MGSEHKGGVVYDYWVSNPWHGRESLKATMADAALEKSMSIAAATRKEEEAAEESDDFSTDVSEHSQSSVDGCSDDSYDASIPGGDALAKDDEPAQVAMPGESRRRIMFVEFCTNPDSRIGLLAPPGWK